MKPATHYLNVSNKCTKVETSLLANQFSRQTNPTVNNRLQAKQLESRNPQSKHFPCEENVLNSEKRIIDKANLPKRSSSNMTTNVPERLSSEGEFSVYLLNALSRDLPWPEVLDTLGTRLVSAVPGATTTLSSNRTNIGLPCLTTGQPCPSDEPTMGSSHPITTATWNNSRSNDHSLSSRDSDKQNSHEQELCAHNNSGHTTPGDLVSPTTIPPTLDPHKVLSTSQPGLTSQRPSPPNRPTRPVYLMSTLWQNASWTLLSGTKHNPQTSPFPLQSQVTILFQTRTQSTILLK